jgi:hypothetical protein
LLKHIVLFGLHSVADAAEIVARAESLRGIETLRSLEVVCNSPEAPSSNADIALICDFDDIAGLDSYQVHPLHVAFGEFLTPLRSTRACIDYEV